MFKKYNPKVGKLHKTKDFESFYNPIGDNDFPIKKYVERETQTAPMFLYSEDDYTGDVFTFLMEHGTLLSATTVGRLGSFQEDVYSAMKGGTIWFEYKKGYVRLTIKDRPDDNETVFRGTPSTPPSLYIEDDEPMEDLPNESKIFSITFVIPITIQDFPFSDFVKFIIPFKENGKVHLFIKDQYGEYNFEPIQLSIPKNMDISLNYGEKFVEINNTIVSRLKEKPNGLYMFHGSPGTGKTSYIKYLASQINRDFIYIPTNMLEYFTTDPNSLAILLKKPNSVLILEDAEKAILKRESGGTTSAVSSLLNLSDGIMSDIMKTAIIVTYNCSEEDIDDALLRKGRLQMDYKFDLLSKEDAVSLAKSLEYPEDFIEEEITAPMSLANIYNLKTKVVFTEKEKKEKRVMGFSSN